MNTKIQKTIQKSLFATVTAGAFLLGFMLFTHSALAATDFTISAVTNAITASAPTKAITLTANSSVTGSTASFALSDGGAGGTFYPSSTVTIAVSGTSTQFVYLPPSSASGSITLQAIATGGIAATHTLAFPIVASSTATTWFQDNFAGSNGTDLLGHTPNIGATWADATISGSIATALDGSGHVYFTGSGHSFMQPIVQTTPPDGLNYDLSATITNINTTVGNPGIDADATTGALGGYRFVCANTNTWDLIVYSAGNVLLTSSACANASNANLQMSFRSINGSHYIFLFVNGSQLTGSPVIDNTFSTGYPGFIPEIPAGQSGSTTANLLSSYVGTNANWNVTSALSVSPSSIPKNHSGNITLTLTGTGTSWNQGTTNFTVSGVSGVTKVSQNITATNAATLVLTTGSSTGALTISDGTNVNTVNVSTGGLSISPTVGSNGSTVSLTLTGTNTVWSQETASGLFSVSGGTGASIGTPTVSSNNSATATLTVGTGSGTLTITDTSTGATTTFTPTTLITFPNASVFQSPNEWMSSGSAIIAPTGGDYLKFNVTGTTQIIANVDTTLNNGVSASSMPTIKVVITSGATVITAGTWVQFPANNTANTPVTLYTGLSSGTTYNVTLYIIGGDQTLTPGYTSTTFQTKINSLQFDAGASLSAATLKPNSCIFWGDSILESYYGGESTGGPTGYPNIVDFSQAWPSLVSTNTLNCEYSQVGVGSQGWVNPGEGGYPVFGTSWNHYTSTQSITFSPAPTYVVIDMGTNDHGQSQSTIATNVQNTLAAMRTAFGSGTKIFILTPYNPTFSDSGQAPRLGIIAGYNAYQTASSDAHTYLIDLGTTVQQYTLSPSSLDNIHPEIEAHPNIATTISSDIHSLILTVPGAPTGATATAGNAQATVSFTAPASDGGSTITGYTVTSSPAGGTDSNAGSTSLTHTITGLTNGTPYTFTVTATNGNGTGSPSSASNSVTPFVPATTFTFTGPSSGVVNVQSTNFTVTPNAQYTGTITITPSGGGLSTPIVLTFSGSSSAQTFKITPSATGTVTLTPTNNGSLTNPSALTYTSNAAPTVPGAPTGAVATVVGSGQVSVTFSAPVSNGGSAITGYTVTANPAGGTDSTAGFSNLTHVVVGLTNGTPYTFTVTATNGVGTGSASAASNSVTPEPFTVPSAPTQLSLSISSDQSVTLTWMAPASDGGSAITDYTVQYRLNGTSSWTTFTHTASTATTQTISGLSFGQTYDFQVAAVNTAGTGAFVADTGVLLNAGGNGGGGSSGGTVITPTQPTTPTTPGTPTAPSNPPSQSGTVLVNDNGTYYVIQNGVKEGVTNPGILASYGYTFSDATPITANQKALPAGANLSPGSGALVKTQLDPTVYLISNGQRYGFASATVFKQLGFSFTKVLIVTTPELSVLPVSTILSNATTAHLAGTDILWNGTVYWIGVDAQLHAYPSPAVYNSWHLANDFSTVVPANQSDMQLPVGSMVVARS